MIIHSEIVSVANRNLFAYVMLAGFAYSTLSLSCHLINSLYSSQTQQKIVFSPATQPTRAVPSELEKSVKS